MTKKQLKKLVKWLESEDYQDFKDNFTTLQRRVDYIHGRYCKEDVFKERALKGFAKLGITEVMVGKKILKTK